MKTLLLVLLPIYLFSQTNNCEIKIKINLLKNSPIYFGYHYGENQYVIDTLYLNANGETVLNKKEQYPQGIYFIALPSMKYVSFILPSEQNFSISTDTTSLLRNLSINNKENEIFKEFQIKLNDYKQTIASYRKKALQYKDSLDYYVQKTQQIKEQFQKYQIETANNHKELLAAKIIKALILKDFTFKAETFFEYVDFSDERLLFTPVFSTVIDEFFYNLPGLTTKNIDSLHHAIDYIMMQSLKNTSVYEEISKYLISQFDLSGNYSNPDAFLYMAEKYFLTDLIPWVNDGFKSKLKRYIQNLRKVTINETFPSLTLYTSEDKAITFPDNSKKKTIILFWDPECNHCVEYLFKLKEAIEPYEKKLVVYTILTGKNIEKWKNTTTQLYTKWIHLYDKKLLNDFIEELFLYNTPQLFLLDENQKIIAKDLTPLQLIEWLK